MVRGDGVLDGDGVREVDSFGGVLEGVPKTGVPETGVRRGLGSGNSMDSSSSSLQRCSRRAGGSETGAFARRRHFLRSSTSSTLTRGFRNVELQTVIGFAASDSDMRRLLWAPLDQCS